MRCLSVVIQRIRHHRLLALALFLTLGLGVASGCFADRQIVINTSPSVPPGLYVRSGEPPRVGALIDFQVPDAARRYVRLRTGENGTNWYILKPIVAGPGDHVDTTGDGLVVNGHWLAPMVPPRDSQGRELLRWREARTLGPDEFFVFSDRIPNSFDSRCYGPITRQWISDVRKPLVTW